METYPKRYESLLNVILDGLAQRLATHRQAVVGLNETHTYKPCELIKERKREHETGVRVCIAHKLIKISAERNTYLLALPSPRLSVPDQNNRQLVAH